jgi:hypothetical protein
VTDLSRREVLNYLAGLRFIERNQRKTSLTHSDVLRLHALDLLKPLIQAGIVKRIGTRKSGRYILN